MDTLSVARLLQPVITDNNKGGMAWNAMAIVGLILLVVGLIHIIVGIVLYEQNVKNRKEQQWYVWLLFVLGGLVTIVGLVLMIIGIRKPKKPATKSVDVVNALNSGVPTSYQGLTPIEASNKLYSLAPQFYQPYAATTTQSMAPPLFAGNFY